MKKNITIVCLNDNIRIDCAREFAKANQMFFLDVDDLLDFELIDRKMVSIKYGDECLTKLEKECMERVANYENCVYSVSCDLFLANDNRFFLEDTEIVYLETHLENIDLKKVKNKTEREKIMQNLEISQNINDYLKNTVKNVVKDADLKTTSEIVQEISNLINN